MKATEIIAAIQSKIKRAPETHNVESLGVDLQFRHLSGLESDNLQLAVIDSDTGKVAYGKLKGHRAKLIAACLVDEDGNSVATADEIASWDNDVINDLHNICRKINKMGKEDIDEEVKS